jgi:hypothetical protein
VGDYLLQTFSFEESLLTFYQVGTLSIDISQSWTIGSVSANQITKPSAMLNVRRPCLWYDPETTSVYEWGGWSIDDDQTYPLWSFSPESNGSAAWNQDPAPAVVGQMLTAPFGSAWTSSSTSFYSLGGAMVPSSGIPTVAMQGLITLDYVSITWDNTTTNADSQSGYFVQSEAKFIPAFGVIIAIGGDVPPDQSYQYEAGATLANMSTIYIYDIQGQAWYTQQASGTIPPPRSEFCMVGAGTADNSSYEL